MGFLNLFRTTDQKISKAEKGLDNILDEMSKVLPAEDFQKLKLILELSEAFNALMKEHGAGMPGVSYLRGEARVGLDEGDSVRVPFFMMFGFGKRVVETAEAYAASERERVKNRIDWNGEGSKS